MANPEELYIYLSSTVLSTVFQNTISSFQTNFKTPIRLEEGFEYEVGLVKISFPSQVKNMWDGRFEYWSFARAQKIVKSIETGKYSSAVEIGKEFREIIGKMDYDHYELKVDEERQCFVLTCHGVKTRIEFSKNIQSLTGLPAVVKTEGKTVGKSFDLTAGIRHLFCYTDIIKNINIGDTVAPILSVVQLKGRAEGQEEYEPRNPIYVPMSNLYLDSVKVELRTHFGLNFPFISGDALLLIHIRPRLPRL